MRVYYDPSVLIALYLPEPLSPQARAAVDSFAEPILINELQELEFRNGVRQKVLRREITEGDLAQSLRIFDDDCLSGKVMRKPLVWTSVFAVAEKLSRRHSPKMVCRSFDLLHVAIASASAVKHFATFDGEQAGLARTAGMKMVDFQL